MRRGFFSQRVESAEHLLCTPSVRIEFAYFQALRGSMISKYFYRLGAIVLGICGCCGCSKVGSEGVTPSPSTSNATVATPQFNPQAGSYNSAQSVVISSTTPNATIFFTTDGSTPDRSSNKYDRPVSVSTNTTLKAMATASGKMDSLVGTAAYVVSSGSSGQTYSTDFPSTENPIAGNGHWINGRATGLDWSDCQTTGGSPGYAFGTQVESAQFLTDDSTCVLTGTWGPNQTAQGIIKVNPPLYSGTSEVELRLNTTITAHSITGYEITCGFSGYVEIVRWDMNPDFSWHTLSQVPVAGCPNGAVFKATNVNGRITAYLGGTPITSVTDQSYRSGSPGMGFYVNGANNGVVANSAFGFSSFSASD
jgi:hypothetical protein